MDVDRAPRPGIFQVGKVVDDGHTIAITGWGLNYCAAHCHCHDPLRIREDLGNGRLGLAKNYRCDCCQPWTADELAAVVRDLADVAALETA